MPKIANYLRDGVKAKSVAVVYVNNDFGKGGRDAIVKELAARDIKVVADVSTEAGQADFAADVIKVKAPTPTQCSSISTRRRARASCARPRSRG